MNKMNQVSLLLLSLAASKAMALTPEGVGIRSFVYGGSGCNPKSFDAHLTLDKEDGLLLTLPSMQVEWGPNHPKVYSRQNCVMTMDLVVPQGWQYALDAWEAIGTVDLEPGVRAEVSLQHFFEGGTAKTLFHSYEEPERLDFTIRDYIPLEDQQWSNCNAPRKLNFNTKLRMVHAKPDEYPNARGWLELGRHWELNQFQLRLNWRRCS